MGSAATGSEIPRTTGGTLSRSRRTLRGTGGTGGGFSWYGAASSTISSAATPSWAAPGELWRQVMDPMRDNTPKKH